MIHSYNKNNSEYDFFGLNSDKKKKKTEPNTSPYRAVLNYDSAPSLLGEIPSSDNTPSLFATQSEGERIRKTLQSAVDKALGKGKYSGIFDAIDTKKIEENIPLAESVIKKNKQKNAYSVEDTKNLPYLREGGAEAAANAVATNCNAIIFNPARANYEAYGLDRDGYTGNITAFVVEGEPLDAVLDFISFFPFIPQQEANTYELKKEKNPNNHSKKPFKELKRNFDESMNLHKIDSIIDTLKEQ